MPSLTLRFLVRCLVAVAITATITLAQAIEPVRRDELDISLQTLVLIIGMSMFGGIVGWFSRVKAGTAPSWSLMHLIGELCTSAFAGFLCFLVCDAFSMNVKLTIGLIGVAGHMGTRAIILFERFAERKWGAVTGGSLESKP